MGRYIVSIRREKRQAGLSADQIASASGVRVIHSSSRGGLIIEADSATISRLQQLHRHDFIIEPEILHASL